VVVLVAITGQILLVAAAVGQELQVQMQYPLLAAMEEMVFHHPSQVALFFTLAAVAVVVQVEAMSEPWVVPVAAAMVQFKIRILEHLEQ
jgi:hypothetical protein